MTLKPFLYAGLSVLALGGAAQAAGSPDSQPDMAGGLPGVFDARQGEPVLLAQAGDPTVQNLEEQMRALNGRVEELNFQINQMQEQLRKIQEDNEFRFQELEGGKKSDAGSGTTGNTLTKALQAGPPKGDQTSSTNPPVADGLPPPAQPGQDIAGGAQPGVATPDAGSNTFGTITFDPNGNVVGGSVGDQATIGADPNGAEPMAGADNTVVAALPQTNDPEQLYRDSYDFILSGQYATAEAGFGEHIKRFPEDGKTADAHFWLGEAQLGQRKYRAAAETFLGASKTYPKSKKAPEMLLKLGVSMVGLNQRDVACATFAEVGKRYPNISGAMKERVQQEQTQAAC